MTSQTRQKVYLVIAAYNEAARIVTVINEAVKYVNKIIVVDDGSTDDTCSKIEKLPSYQTDQVILLKHKVNLGQGAALETGFCYCRRKEADVVVTFDADGQLLAKEIPRMVEPIIKNQAEVVLGSRFLGKTIALPLSRKIVLKLGIVFTNVFSGIKVNDTHNGFRALSKKALQFIKLKQPRMAHASEILDQIARYQLGYVEVPVTVVYDSYSKKKGQSLWNTISIMIDILMQKFD